jgi:hypothetical protein
MSQRPRDLRNLATGVVLGVVATLALGQARAPDRRPAQPVQERVQRYQISAMRDNNGNDYLFILDHETQQVHRRSANGIGANSPTVMQLIKASS